MADKNCRCFLGILYPDAENYDCQEVLKRLPLVFQSYAYILHDKDSDSQGVLKKPHFHWVGRRIPSLLSTVVNLLGVPENSIEYCHSFRASIRYLPHLDDPDKFQYPIEAVQGSFPARYLKEVVEESEFVASALAAIYDNKIESIRQLQAFALEQQEWSSFRRNYSLLKDALFEWNSFKSLKGGGPFDD